MSSSKKIPKPQIDFPRINWTLKSESKSFRFNKCQFPQHLPPTLPNQSSISTQTLEKPEVETTTGAAVATTTFAAIIITTHTQIRHKRTHTDPTKQKVKGGKKKESNSSDKQKKQKELKAISIVYLGIKVFVTAGSEEKLKACKDLGADVGINYKTEDFVTRVKEETGGKGYTMCLSTEIDHWKLNGRW